ncbi:MAG: hypothetical protein ACM3PP_05690 [Candidatus Saccharibacteria bacterium]
MPYDRIVGFIAALVIGMYFITNRKSLIDRHSDLRDKFKLFNPYKYESGQWYAELIHIFIGCGCIVVGLIILFIG